MAHHNHHRFIASSLLLVYDADEITYASPVLRPAAPVHAAAADAGADENTPWRLDESPLPPATTPIEFTPCCAAAPLAPLGIPPLTGAPSARAHLIDFGHVTALAPPAVDTGYVHGLTVLLDALRTVHRQFTAVGGAAVAASVGAVSP
jgi:hypothetical protein